MVLDNGVYASSIVLPSSLIYYSTGLVVRHQEWSSHLSTNYMHSVAYQDAYCTLLGLDNQTSYQVGCGVIGVKLKERASRLYRIAPLAVRGVVYGGQWISRREPVFSSFLI
jgi:hypothetical protein